MRKTRLATALLLVAMVISGCSYRTDVIIDENGKYTVESRLLDKEVYEDELGTEIPDVLDSETTENTIDSVVAYKKITSDTFVIRIRDGVKFTKTSNSFNDGISVKNDNTVYSMKDNIVTVKFTQSVKETNGEIDSSDNTKVTFDLTKNMKKYYASTNEQFKFDDEAPVIKGFKNGKIYKSSIKVSCTDSDLESLSINGKDITKKSNSYIVSKNGTYLVEAIDKSGNKTSSVFFINKDTKVPEIYYDTTNLWVNDGEVDLMKKVGKSGIIKTSGQYYNEVYLCIADLDSLSTTISDKYALEIQKDKIIDGVKCTVRFVNNKEYYTIEKDKQINGLKSVKINGKSYKVNKNGLVVIKAKVGKTYKISAIDKSGNKVYKTITIKK